VGASLFFYGWWNPIYLPLIATSIVFNYGVGLRLARSDGDSGGRGALILGVSGNLAALGYFKYANFFVDNLAGATGAGFELAPIVLPLAISFFTFQQIAYLADVHRSGVAERSFLDYSIFVTFFPQLIAGPIVHHGEMLPQFANPDSHRFQRRNLEVGLTLFFMGLFKKSVIADGVAVYSTPIFEAAALGGEPALFEAWGAALAYTFQLYFDFSGYSDMAIGLGWLFGIRLPMNFDSPYRATNIIEFWRRWHMSLSRFLRDYLYFPLGGNRRGPTRRYMNLMITMLLGGLWHGAGWTFLIWGGLHGLYLLANHGWRGGVDRLGWHVHSTLWTRGAARGVTFLFVVIAWVFFRAERMDVAERMFAGMLGANGAAWPEAGATVLAWCAGLLAVVWLAPNTQEIMARFDVALSRPRDVMRVPGWAMWRPTAGWAVASAWITVWAILGINKYSEFLYFQF
jgi:D-alanyl-lipoteichoic acid acyltransferase DltB (MBOAT superfamily)